MSRLARMPWFWVCLPLLLAGCADNPMVLNGKLAQAEKEKAQLLAQNQELQRRVDSSARDNQQLHENLAREQQQVAISEKLQSEKSKQLHDLAVQLKDAREARDRSENQVRILSASMQRQGGVTISPNNTALPEIRIADATVRRDGDVIRIELPSDNLFEGTSVRLRPEAVNWICGIAAEVARNYPDQLIGIEGHTDNSPVVGGSNHDLSVARALAVYNVLISQTRLQANQLVVVGRGANNPILSNSSAAGKQRNRRVELVVYPERKTSDSR